MPRDGGVATRVSERPAESNANDIERTMGGDNVPSGITSIKNDGEVTHSEPTNQIALPPPLRTSIVGSTIQDITSYLQRPYELVHGKWSGASTSPLYSINCPVDIISSNTTFGQKMQGFLAFRATIVIRVQVNANRFQQGRLILHHVPQSVQQALSPGLWSCWKGALTQHRNVQLDANCDTEMILEVPYMSQSLAYDLMDGTGGVGTIYLSIYAPLKYGTGSSEAEYTIWASFKDIELHTPTMQSSFVAQGGSGRKLAPAVKEQKAAGVGPISGVATVIRDAADVFGGIPILSEVAGVTSWFANAVAGAASAFGWSNPPHLGPCERMRTEALPYHNNCDAVATPYYSGLMSQNSVALLPSLAGTDLDEMSLKFLLTRNSFYNNYTWSTTTTSGSTLLTLNLSPSTFAVTESDTYATGSMRIDYQNCTPLAYFSSFFAYWRGGFKVTLKFPKTEFHSGRLVLCWAPNYSSATPTLQNSAYLMREIIDMRMGSEFTYIIPYCSTKPYLRNGDSMGRLYLLVQNELVAPDTVSSTIDVLLEVAGASDFEVAAPVPSIYINPYIPNTFSAQSGFQGRLTPVFKAEGGEPHEGENPCKISDGAELLGGGIMTTDGHASALYCIGEKINSILQILKRRSEFRVVGPPTQIFQFDPWFRQWGTYNATTGYVAPTLSGDLFTMMTVCFGFLRGGVRIFNHDWSLTGTDGGAIAALLFEPDSDTPYLNYDGSVTAAPYAQSSLVIHTPSKAGGLEVQVPMYHRFHTMFGAYNYGATDSSSYAQRFRLKIVNNAAAYGNFSFGRAVGDDFQLGCFVSIPPMYVGSYNSA